jgi:uncharacterized membrane protein
MKFIIAFLLGGFPLIEARTAMPIAIAFGLSPLEAFISAYLGSLAVLPLALYLASPFFNWLKKVKFISRWARGIHAYIYKKGRKIRDREKKCKFSVRQWKIIGLFFFVGIPLPLTGIWSGSVVAQVIKLDKKTAAWVIAIANLMGTTLIFMLIQGIISLPF